MASVIGTRIQRYPYTNNPNSTLEKIKYGLLGAFIGGVIGIYLVLGNNLPISNTQYSNGLEDRVRVEQVSPELPRTEYLEIVASPGIGWYDLMEMSGIPREKWGELLEKFIDEVYRLNLYSRFDVVGNPRAGEEYKLPTYSGSNRR